MGAPCTAGVAKALLLGAGQVTSITSQPHYASRASQATTPAGAPPACYASRAWGRVRSHFLRSPLAWLEIQPGSMFASLRTPCPAPCQALLFLDLSPQPPASPPPAMGQPEKPSGDTLLRLENKGSPVLYCPIWGEPARAGVGKGAGVRVPRLSEAAEPVLWGSVHGV